MYYELFMFCVKFKDKLSVWTIGAKEIMHFPDAKNSQHCKLSDSSFSEWQCDIENEKNKRNIKTKHKYQNKHDF